MSTLDLAISIAVVAHHGITDKAGRPTFCILSA